MYAFIIEVVGGVREVGRGEEMSVLVLVREGEVDEEIPKMASMLRTSLTNAVREGGRPVSSALRGPESVVSEVSTMLESA